MDRLDKARSLLRQFKGDGYLFGPGALGRIGPLDQRRLRIGFNRAARFIEQMEMDGVIGPQDGSKPRLVRKKD